MTNITSHDDAVERIHAMRRTIAYCRGYQRALADLVKLNEDLGLLHLIEKLNQGVTALEYPDETTAAANAECADSACARCGHSWGSHCYDREGNELPDVGRCNKCECYSWR